MHKLISLLSFSVVNKTVDNNRATVYCIKRDICAEICCYSKGRQTGPYVARVIKVRLLYLACAHPVCTELCCAAPVLGRAVLAASPGPPAVEDMFSVCVTQCIFNELPLSNIFNSVGLNDANKSRYRLHIAPALAPINNNATYEIMFLQIKQEVALTKLGFKKKAPDSNTSVKAASI